MECIVAIDPGKTSGYCIGTHYENKLFLTPGQEQFSLIGMQNFVGHLPMHAYIVYEDFEYRAYSKAGLDLTPVKMIGIIELERDLRDGSLSDHFFKQKASEGKGFWDNDKLKEHEVYVKGMPHGMDAMRHLLHFTKFKYGSTMVGANVEYVLDVARIHLEGFYTEEGLGYASDYFRIST